MLQRITAKITLLIVMTGLIPLIVFGFLAIQKAQHTSVNSIIQGNERVAIEVAGRIDQYLNNALMILNSLAENLNHAHLEDWQKEKIIRNFAIHFDQFNFIRILDLNGNIKLTSEITLPEQNFKDSAEFRASLKDKTFISDVFINKDLVPAIFISIPIKSLDEVDSVLLAQVDLLDLWKLVEELKIGDQGYLNLLTKDGKIFASGDGQTKVSAIQMANYPNFGELKQNLKQSFEMTVNQMDVLVVSAVLPSPFSWIVTVVQPTSEAYALPADMRRQLILAIVLFLIATLILGWILGKKEILEPINRIMQRIREISQGKLAGNLSLVGHGEFTELAETLNKMSEDLIQIQEELIKSEKHALLGRIASGIAHDLKHPITSIENYTRVLEFKYQDPQYRQLFLTTISREFKRLHAFLENLRDLSKDLMLNPVKTSLNQVIDDTLITFVPEFEQCAIMIEKSYISSVMIDLDLFSFQRVLYNLIRNAREAMVNGGVLKVEIETNKDEQKNVVLKISDTGPGIPKDILENLFEDFKTTKRGGLGLGLAISKKIISEHGGWIEVQSQEGLGTSFLIYLPG